MPKIKEISAHKAVNSRGEWTVEAHVVLDDGAESSQIVPEGASKGENEAVYIKVEKAVEVVSGPINDLLYGHDPFDQNAIDKMMLDMDGTENKSHLGGNSILAVSMAVANACAVSRDIELYEHLGALFGNTSFKMPTPVFNVINGGKHAHNGLSFQEFMLIPSRTFDIKRAVEVGVEVYHQLKADLQADGHDVDVGDEGGFAPSNFTVDKALTYLRAAASKKYKPGEDVFFGSDVAAESFYIDNKYEIREENKTLTGTELAAYYAELLKKFEIIYLEDPFYEKDFISWKDFFASFKDKVMVVGDDLVVTNPKFLKKAIKNQWANAVIVKPNQVGSLTETLDFIKMAQDADMEICVSHRSGDNAEDTFIADLAYAVASDFIKSGAPARGERVAKYNRLLEIAQENA